MSRRLRLLIAGDHEPTRDSLATALKQDGRFEVCAEAADAAAAVDAALREQPDLCLLDVEMPGNGIAAAWEIRQRLPETTIVMMTVSGAEDDLLTAIRAGAAGYLPKDMDPERLPHALWGAHHGEGAVPRVLMARIISHLRDGSPNWRRLAHSKSRLSTREWQVLELLQQNLDSRTIAERLSLSPATVRSHRARIMQKLRANDEQELLAHLERPSSRPGRKVGP
jgi:two-component system nitrate/nitrite response regulator NarL